MKTDTKSSLSTSLRTHTCESLRRANIGETVTLSGWVHRRRDHGGLIFIDLRDRYGLTQLVFDPKINSKVHHQAQELRSEWTLQATGKVRSRSEGMTNTKLVTGEIEIEVTSFHPYAMAKTPPFSICDESIEANDDIRSTYRFLDLRRGSLIANQQMRYKTTMAMREFFYQKGFLEIETPILCKSTPEGARDYIVPSRVHPGMFYALPQSPQIFKQLLMIGGLDRYYQIARCFRDEDLRADRQPEFTQLDVEMSFIKDEDIIRHIEEMLGQVFKRCLGLEIPASFRRMTYADCMEFYGCDRPDLRFDLKLVRIDEIAMKSNFTAIKEPLLKGGIVKALPVKGGGNFSRKEIDDMATFVAKFGLQGLAWMKMTAEGLSSGSAKFFDESLQKELIAKTKVQEGDLILIAAAPESIVNQSLDHLRRHIAEKMNLIDPNRWEFLWVVDFPLFEADKDTGLPSSVHHPFTMPHEEDIHLLDTDPLKVRAQAYDVVLNGYELGGGSIRIHNQDLQRKIFQLLHLTPDEIDQKFGFFIRALEFGTPPHGGIALGLDRVVMLLCKCNSIKDVICFPKTQKASDIMMDCPSAVSRTQLDDLHIRTK